MRDRILRHLAKLVGFDTRNPPRAIAADHPMFSWLGEMLGAAFSTSLVDHGKGRVSFLATRGTPRLLFNVHLDTVPVGDGWSIDPLKLTVDGQRAIGRGACDIKGAAACLLALAETGDEPLGILFTTDEEGDSGRCVREYCRGLDPTAYDAVVVAEPTSCRAVREHRGYLSVIGRFAGRSGHSSELRALTDNAIHDFSRWSAAALAEVEREASDARSCFNIGRVEGGIKSNVIADALEVRWSARLPGGTSNDAYFERMTALPGGRRAEWLRPFSGPPLPAPDGDREAIATLIRDCELRPGKAVDFWTEASLFSHAGLPAMVLGPGDIAQAHAVDEWVAIDDLLEAERCYRRMVEYSGNSWNVGDHD